ncbi:MAG TPA: aspartyl protease family protein [Rhizomicrobium sp.]
MAGAAFAAFFLVATAAQAAAPNRQPIPLPSQPAAPAPTGPDLAFHQGEFDQAKAGYAAVPKSSPHYADAQRGLGEIALFENRLGEADVLLANAHKLNPADLHTVGLMAQSMEREGRYADMVQLLRQVGRPERAVEFEMFSKVTPYRIPAHQATATIPMEWTDPLPVVKAKVNDFEGLFLIDTGAPEIILDPDFARFAHVQTSNDQTKGAAPGARTSPINFGRIAKFTLPGVETDDIPAMLLSTRGFTASARNKRVAGIIGTEFLSHYRATLDYPHDRLILEPHDAPAHGGGSLAEVPFWLIGDHFIVAMGRLDQGPKQLILADTGVGAYSFSAPQSTLRDAGIAVPSTQVPAKSPIGEPPSAKFPIAKLSFGTLTESNLEGIYGIFPPGLEDGLGVHVGGVVSHGFFHNYAVTLDFGRMTISFRK